MDVPERTAGWPPPKNIANILPRLPRGAPGLGKPATARRRAQRKAYLCRLQRLCTPFQSDPCGDPLSIVIKVDGLAPRIDHRAYSTPVPDFDYDADLDLCHDPPVEEIDASVTDVVLAIDVDKIYLLAKKARLDISHNLANILRDHRGRMHFDDLIVAIGNRRDAHANEPIDEMEEHVIFLTWVSWALESSMIQLDKYDMAVLVQ